MLASININAYLIHVLLVEHITYNNIIYQLSTPSGVSFDFNTTRVLSLYCFGNMPLPITFYYIQVLLLQPLEYPYSVVVRRPFSTDAIIFFHGLLFPIVFRIHLSRHAISSYVGHAFDCIYGLCSLSTSWSIRCRPF